MAKTLRDIWDNYLAFKAKRVKISTLATYRICFDNNIMPIIGDLDMMQGFSNLQMNKYITYLLGTKKLSKHSARDCKMLLCNMLRYAADYEGFPPVTNYNIDWPSENREQKKRLKFFTKEECQKVFDAMEASPSPILLCIMIGLTTGMRIGEICGLRFSDVDFVNHTVHVQRTIERVTIDKLNANYMEDIEIIKSYMKDVKPYKTGKKSILIASKPKTRTSDRICPLATITYRWIKNYSKIASPNSYILTQKEGACETRTIRNAYYKCLEELGLPPLNPHCMRHTFATQMLHGKIDVATIADILGHSSPAITLEIYSHTDEQQKMKAVNRIFANRKAW